MTEQSRRSGGGARVKAFATNSGLIKQLRRGVPGLRAVRSVFRARPADLPHLRSLVFQAVDPDLLTIMLGRELGATWVPPLWKLYNNLRAANGPAFRSDVFPGWQKAREEWVQLWLKLRSELGGAAASGAPKGAGAAVDRAGGRPVPARRRADVEVPAVARRSPSSDQEDRGYVDLGAHGSDRLVSIDGVVHRHPDPGAGDRPAPLRRDAGRDVGAERPSPVPSLPIPEGSAALPPVPPGPRSNRVAVPLPKVPKPDFSAIAGLTPGFVPPYLVHLLLAMRSHLDDVDRVRQAWLAMGGDPDLWDQWMWPGIKPADWFKSLAASGAPSGAADTSAAGRPR